MMSVDAPELEANPIGLPDRFKDWFAARGWQARPHQLELLERAGNGRGVLLIAPTGAGKTLAGFLPSLVDLDRRGPPKSGQHAFGPHTLYVSPLKALATDIARNLEAPVREMDLKIRLETRTGDTPTHKRQRQKRYPPDILLTTPEQVALLLASREARRFFGNLRYVIFDELHALVTSKRGDLLALGLARMRRHSPQLTPIGLSATVADPDALRAWLTNQKKNGPLNLSDNVFVSGGAKPNLSILRTEQRIPWQGHSARYALPDIYRTIKEHGTTLLFVNTRWQAELLFQELWKVNADNLTIALHHGSLDRGQRRKVESAMSAGSLRAVVATSTLDLGIDWGDVDLVIHVGAPKGASRLAQRIGRSNHRMDEPSKGLLVPSNRFEVLECQAALDANYLGHQDTPPLRTGALDVLAQHVLGMAVAEPFDLVELFDEVTSSYTYRDLEWDEFDRVVDFVATGGYALRTYERFAKIRRRRDGLWSITHPSIAQQYRLNSGTIVEVPMLNVRLGKSRANSNKRAGNTPAAVRGGRVLGKVEEYFIETLTPGDTFRFAGQVLRFEGIRENEAFVSKSPTDEAQIPAYAGGKFPLTTYLAEVVRGMLSDPSSWHTLPDQVRVWLEIQQQKSVLPSRDELLVETFPRGSKFYLVTYPFEGRMAHQTLGMLLTRRLERARARPMGFVANDYALAVWGLRDLGMLLENQRPALSDLFDEDMLGDDLEAWMADSYLLKRTFRGCAVISGLIERHHPGQEKTGRQVTVSTDLIYDVLRSHEPNHILLQATRADAATGLLDVKRLAEMLSRVSGRIRHQSLTHVSPLAVPAMLEIGKEPITGEVNEALLSEASDNLITEALGVDFAEHDLGMTSCSENRPAEGSSPV